MDTTAWGMVLLVGLIAGAAGALIYAQRLALLRAAALSRRALEWRLRGRLRPRTAPAAAPVRRTKPAEDAFVLMPDGRPWPLGPAVQVLELAWRWQVVHGANLPARARQGEGAYVWRPPLPRNTGEQAGSEAEP